MPIRRSAAAETRHLVADLLGEVVTAREAALARLRVIGAAAVTQLLAALDRDLTPQQRTLVWRALDGRSEPRVVHAILDHISRPDEASRLSAIAAAAPLLARDVDPSGLDPRLHAPEPLDETALHPAEPADHDRAAITDLLDRLTAIVVNTTEPQAVRLVALAALGSLPERTREPLRARLLEDPDPIIREAAARGAAAPAANSAEDQSPLADSPDAVVRTVALEGAGASLSVLHKWVTTIRERERNDTRAGRSHEWRVARGSLHQALALRDSRVALYDLRETFEQAAEPLPETFTAAISRVGDGTCLDALASAWARTGAAEDAGAWRDGLVEAARAIMTREGITPRSAVVKRLRTRWGAPAEALFSTPSRTARA